MPIKMLTWNINRRTGGIAEKILEVDPDIFVITEIPKNVEPIKDALTASSNNFTFILDDFSKYVLIGSKITMEKTNTVQIPKELKTNVAIADFHNFMLIGAFINGFSPCKENNNFKLGESFVNFLDDIRTLNPNLKIVATGDFDCGYKCKNGYPNFTSLEQNKWQNIWHRDNKVEWIKPVEELKNGSFRRKNKTGKSIPDHIFATENIAGNITKSEFLFNWLDIRLAGDICLSDHAPLIAEIEI